MVEILRAGPASIASLAEIETCDAVLVLGEDLTNTAPRMALALRQTARGAERELAAQKGVPSWLDQAVRIAGEGRRSPIVLATPLPDRARPIATLALRLDPLDIAELRICGRRRRWAATRPATKRRTIAQLLAKAQRPLIIAGSGLGAAEIAGSRRRDRRGARRQGARSR